MTDVLALIHMGEITFEEAYDMLDEAVDRVHSGEGPLEWWTVIGLTPLEHRANLHGASLEQLYEARYRGWPDRCCRCGLSIDPEAEFWWFVYRDDGLPALRHIECPYPPSPDATC